MPFLRELSDQTTFQPFSTGAKDKELLAEGEIKSQKDAWTTELEALSKVNQLHCSTGATSATEEEDKD